MYKPTATTLLESLISLVEQNSNGTLCDVMDKVPKGSGRTNLCEGVDCIKCPFDVDNNKAAKLKLESLIPLAKAVDLIQP